MRIHRLEATAFGPFADRVAVELDQLSDAGLFLLTGATGAGKTSVLDAICFALYGAVPGDRQTAKRLRSDHAAPGVAPEVTLELTVAARRLRIVRSPAWVRPKRRGTGTTQEQARVLVTERVDGTWQPLATRLDEAGHLVTGLLGMNLTQFCQVQLLPQGRFQAFLRADSRERHDLLHQLFRTSRFVAVEAWLRDRRRTLRRDARTHHDRVAGLAGRLSEAAGEPLPAAWDPHDLSPVAEELLAWATDVLARAAQAHADALLETVAAEEADREAHVELERARSHHDRQQRLARARHEHRELTEQEVTHQERSHRLAVARRAATLRPTRAEQARTAREHAMTHQRAVTAMERAATLLARDTLADSELPALHRQVSDRVAQARAQLPLADEHARLEAATAVDRADRDLLSADVAAVEDELATLPDQLRILQADHERARAAGDRLPGARQAAERAATLVEAARRADELTARRTDAEQRWREAVDAAQDLREHWLGIQERRLTGMAAEIAGGLAVGACCPVCGSADHPRPAEAAPDAPDAQAEREARRAVDDAEAERHARHGAVRDLDTAIALAREQTGGRDLAELEAEATRAAESARRLEQEACRLEQAAAGLQEAEAAHEQATTRRSDLVARRAATDAALAERLDRARSIAAQLEALLADTGAETLPQLVEQLIAVEDACREAVLATDERDRAATAAAEARRRAEDCAAEAGFGSLEEIGAAELPDEEITALDDAVRRHEVRLAAVLEVLGDPDLLASEAVPEVDLVAHEQSRHTAAERLSAARAAASRAEERTARLASLGGDLSAAAAAWGPARDQLALVDRMATLVDGSDADNRLRMRLSGYVLAYRLRQVVAAANERLVGMTDARYRLEHSSDRGAGETRGGLSLRVRDDWTGESRDPATLSGGETFVVSLALALGLADVITHEAGGVELDTLFVDEGFGTLDAETLDHVIDMLDGLRDGGRVVGVVSHVAELRDRIPAQLHVRKTRTGSTLHPGGVG
ncbi:AAA family ATPase [Nocardioides coralli]|uniref:AAA family ATPase n=1 Tax=Nocardioides coralli TaxID=2872154 RepID=UPI001CA41667|nr:SMC family ATPase [Nocardioides coralli]QZY27709.1 SMC family ATPase [Nocardioides coralli]